MTCVTVVCKNKKDRVCDLFVVGAQGFEPWTLCL